MADQRISRAARRWLLQLLALGALSSCGGVDSGGTGASLAYGPINGLGSIIVNGVRFDDTGATITDEDGAPVGPERLRLGVTTRVDASAVVGPANDRRASAQSVRVFSELIGPIGAIDATARTIDVLEQTVRITAATVFDDGLPMAFASLQAGMAVEVFAQIDSAAGRYVATRIELRPGAPSYQVRGRIDQVDAAAGTFTVGALVVDYSQLTPTDAAHVAAGATVRARLQTAPSPAGIWQATALTSGQRPIVDAQEARVEGRVSALLSQQRFSIDGVSVDATAALPDSTGTITLGARVSVQGPASGGVVYASEVHVEGDEDTANTDFEVHGLIEALDPVAKVMTVHGITVDYSGAVAFENGTESELRVGRSVEVEGVPRPDGVGLLARKISFEDR